jgi:pyruvate/2-oxoglutarate dehydrogenase complex dihydrolipoamide dehydrogenase (E3) component
VRSRDREVEVEKLFFAVGRPPHLGPLRRGRLGVPLRPDGTPQHDPKTLNVHRQAIYIAGDAAGGIAKWRCRSITR